MNKFAYLFALAKIFEESVSKPQGLLANIGKSPVHSKSYSGEEFKALNWLKNQDSKIKTEEKQVMEFLASIKLDPKSGIYRHLQGPITLQLKNLFERQYLILKKILKNKTNPILAAQEYADNKRKIKRLMNTIEEVTTQQSAR